MLNLPLIPTRFCPSKETLSVLNGRLWVCSYSGGKDSTALVTWVEWLRRVGLARCATPRLVMSDTGVEYPFLRGIADRLMAALSASGWLCEVVEPRIHERLYNRIFGVGNIPVHPGSRKRMRWCTRSTKVDPMARFARSLAPDVLQLSGVRWGESDVRDGKLAARGTSAGGECGLPEPGRSVYGPIITWKTCQVVEWLEGRAGASGIDDLLPLTRELVGVYEVRREQEGFFGIPPKVTSLRFGCIGCPAITRERVIASERGRGQPQWVHLKRLWAMWQELYLRKNRCCRIKEEPARAPARKGPKPTWYSDHVGFGPLRMEARQRYFAELLDIQRQSGVVLVRPQDEAFIRDCWARKVYPRGWSERDELTVPPGEELFGASLDNDPL